MRSAKQFPLQLESMPYRKVELQKVNEVRSLSCSDRTGLILLATYSELLLFDTEYNAVVKKIKRVTSVRSASLSDCGRTILAHFTDNTLRVICARTGRDIGHLIGVPQSAMKFSLSRFGNRVIGGNNRTVCLWRTDNSKLCLVSTNWTNMNCYAINDSGQMFAIGTFNGQIYLLKALSESKCSQIQYNKHEKCVMIMHWSGKRLASVSYDNILLIAEFLDSKGPESDQKQLCFSKYQMEGVPKSINEYDGMYFFTMVKGMYIYSVENSNRQHLEGQTWYPRKNSQGQLELIKSRLVHLQFYKLMFQY